MARLARTHIADPSAPAGVAETLCGKPVTGVSWAARKTGTCVACCRSAKRRVQRGMVPVGDATTTAAPVDPIVPCTCITAHDRAVCVGWCHPGSS